MDQVKTIYVKFECKSIGSNTMQSNKLGRENIWIPIIKQEPSYSIHKNKPQLRIKSSHFPLPLAWGFTVDKVPYLSLSRGVISFDLHHQK